MHGILEQLHLDWGELAPELQQVIIRIATDGVSVAFDQVGVEPSIDMLQQANERAIAYAKERAGELVTMIAESTREMLRSDVTTALEAGLSGEDLADALEARYAFSADRAETISRTELAIADVQGNLAAWRSSGVVDGKQWVLGSEHEAMDECDDAAALGVVALDDDFGGLGDPPAHPNCFLPGTRVSAAGITAHFSRWFEGEVITIRTERQEFTATPNHPVLTRRGWVAVGALEVGDHLFECTDPRATVSLLNPHDHYVETPIEQIARALRMAGGVSTVRVPTTAEDFHGDGVPDGEVDVVLPARALESWSGTHAHEGALDGQLGSGLRDAALLATDGALHEGAERLPFPSNSVVGSSGAALSLLGGETGLYEAEGLSLRADSEAVPPEQIADRQTVAPEPAAEVHRRLAGLIHPVEVREIRKREFAGHVYNLSTQDQWYIAQSIIVHNCVCDVLPVLSDESDDSSDED